MKPILIKIFCILLVIGIIAAIVEFTLNTPPSPSEEESYYPAHLDCAY